jgi:hypothetical protein
METYGNGKSVRAPKRIYLAILMIRLSAHYQENRGTGIFVRYLLEEGAPHCYAVLSLSPQELNNFIA